MMLTHHNKSHNDIYVNMNQTYYVGSKILTDIESLLEVKGELLCL